MKNQGVIDEKWIKASIIGTIWAASEIVLGSFLHNLKVPFSGNLLTGIGMIILISVSYVWSEKGLYWRAGLVCALMKTLSPSAVIFGPMIAIFSESLLLEAAVRIFGKTVFGFILGSMLAMSWNLFHKAINLIIFYGNNLIDLYTNLVKYAEKQLSIHFSIFWLPLVALLALYCIFGAIVGIIGIRTGHRVLKEPALTIKPGGKSNVRPEVSPRSDFHYSVPWLILDIVAMAGLLILVSKARWVYYVPAVSVFTAIWAIRYKRALRQISKPKFWIFFVLITMISAFIFTSVQPGQKNFMQGFMIGIEMNFRAIIIIVGFTVLGTELYNPKIRDLFIRSRFRQLPLAIELSAESLPSMIASVPDVKTLFRNPVSILSQMISGVEHRLMEIRTNPGKRGKVFILTGEIGEGKTTTVIRLAEALEKSGIPAGGIISPRVIDGNRTVGYDIVDINDPRALPFLRDDIAEERETIGRFRILESGLKAGHEIIDPVRINEYRLVIIDEAGPLELKKRGWYDDIKGMLHRGDQSLLLVVRKKLVSQVKELFQIHDCTVFDITKESLEFIIKKVEAEI